MQRTPRNVHPYRGRYGRLGNGVVGRLPWPCSFGFHFECARGKPKKKCASPLICACVEHLLQPLHELYSSFHSDLFGTRCVTHQVVEKGQGRQGAQLQRSWAAAKAEA